MEEVRKARGQQRLSALEQSPLGLVEVNGVGRGSVVVEEEGVGGREEDDLGAIEERCDLMLFKSGEERVGATEEHHL